MKREGSKIADEIIKRKNIENYYKKYADRKRQIEENKKRY